jgi:hypothetical protein
MVLGTLDMNLSGLGGFGSIPVKPPFMSLQRQRWRWVNEFREPGSSSLA